jgi:hypothetical protein
LVKVECKHKLLALLCFFIGIGQLDAYCNCLDSIDNIGILFIFKLMQILKRFCDGLRLEMVEAIIGLIEELDV